MNLRVTVIICKVMMSCSVDSQLLLSGQFFDSFSLPQGPTLDTFHVSMQSSWQQFLVFVKLEDSFCNDVCTLPASMVAFHDRKDDLMMPQQIRATIHTVYSGKMLCQAASLL